MIEVRKVDVYYGNIQALKNVSISVNNREIVAIIGANGSGKSTLIKAITGMVPKRSGDVHFEGRSITTLPLSQMVRLGIAVIPEGRRLFGTMSVVDNMMLGAYPQITNGGFKKVQEELQRVFELFPILKERKRQQAASLSGGEQQMLAIGRALMAKPKVILMDEPSLGLAPLMVAEIFRIVRALKDQGISILLIEQNARMSLEVSDRTYVLETGSVILDGKSAGLLKNELVRKSYLGY
ncbi:MAG: ABC transporter ATP-binding protein [Proteobacteria bacterium]|nr:ABC transporter ATP-binding protein [Pseudomonadota bacterium]